MEINREPIRVLYKETKDTPTGIQALFDELCASVDNLENRRFFGASTGPTGTYRACVEKLTDDDPAAMGLTDWALPGGLFASERVEDWLSDSSKIAAAFQRVLTKYDGRISDWGWGVEEYLADDVVNVLIKIYPA
jgi:hypothetical protein